MLSFNRFSILFLFFYFVFAQEKNQQTIAVNSDLIECLLIFHYEPGLLRKKRLLKKMQTIN
jgi:hypothetical protein